MKMIPTPMSEEDVRKLKLGEVVFLDGLMVTGRDEMHMRAMEYSDEGREIPKILEGATLFHCGPIMKKEGDSWIVLAAGPTTSARMDKLEPEMIRRFGIRAIVGKGGMSREVCDAMREVGCVYLAATGGAAVTLADALRCKGVEWEDLGMAEAMWKFDSHKFGPLVVAIDSRGESLYEKVGASLKR